MARGRQQTLEAPGMEGPDPELDRLARECLAALDEEEKASAKVSKLEDELKAKMDETGDAAITVEGVTFKITIKKTLTKKGRHDRSEGRE